MSATSSMPEEVRVWKKCGHPRTPDNTCDLSEHRPGGRCRQCRVAASAAWRAANKDRKRAANAAWYAANKDRKRAANAAWYAANKDRKRAANAAWSAAHPLRQMLYNARYAVKRSQLQLLRLGASA